MGGRRGKYKTERIVYVMPKKKEFFQIVMVTEVS